MYKKPVIQKVVPVKIKPTAVFECLPCRGRNH